MRKRTILAAVLAVILTTGVSAQIAQRSDIERHMLLTVLDAAHRYMLFAADDSVDPDEIAVWVYGDICRMLWGDHYDACVGESLNREALAR